MITMSNSYNTFFNSVGKNVYRSVNFVSKKIALGKEPSYSFKYVTTTGVSYKAQRKNDEESIKKDYKKTGQDLFGALNKYEKSKGFRITTR